MPQSRDRETRGRAALATAQLGLAILALSFTPILFRVSELGPSASSFYRTMLAIPIFLGWLAIERRQAGGVGLRVSVSWRREGFELFLASACFAANILAYAWALGFTAVANASVIGNLAPIYVSLASFFLFGERPSRGFVAAMIAAIAGVALLTYDKLALGGGRLLGDGLAMVSAICFAGYLIVVARLRQRLVSAAIMIWIAALSAVDLLAFALLADERLVATTVAGWAALLGLALVSYALGQGLLTAALSHLSAAFSSVALLSLPAVSALLGWLLLDEPLTANQIIGGAIVLGSIFFARRASR
jgi:drug/metabolite transporter (DMT)-like permease